MALNLDYSKINISENSLLSCSKELLETLLIDRTTGKNIYWATEDYKDRGEGFSFFDPITIEKITGTDEEHEVIKPRVSKSKEEQKARAKNNAEVFTPSWICNAQNNLVDEAWFGHKAVFNVERQLKDGTHTWTAKPEINLHGKDWQEYVSLPRMEITCGEAPYLVSRYDTTTGKFIELDRRIGLLDRKFKVMQNNIPKLTEGQSIQERERIQDTWRKYTYRALQSVYGFEWQGDNLLLAREAILITCLENYIEHFGTEPTKIFVLKCAEIISWNIWQMDGLSYGLPKYEVKEHLPKGNELKMDCQELKPEEKYCRIMKWISMKPVKGETIKFVELIQK